MISSRETILARLETVVKVTGVATAARNTVRFDYQTTELPAVAVIDGDEEADDSDPRASKHPAIPRRVHMAPYVLVQVGGRPDEIGPALNTLTDRIIDAVLNDATLRGAVINGVGIRYDGMVAPRIENGHVILNARQLRFTFSYLRRPAQA